MSDELDKASTNPDEPAVSGAPDGRGVEPTPRPEPPAARGVEPMKRPRMAPKPPPKPSNLKKHLMIWIIVLTVVLSGAIIWKWVRISQTPEAQKPRSIDKELPIAFGEAEKARSAIDEIEKRVGEKGEALKAEDMQVIKKNLEILESSAEKIQSMMEEVRKAEIKQKLAGQSEQMVECTRASQKVKFWIFDANGLKDANAEGLLEANDPTILKLCIKNSKNPKTKAPPGLYIPMYAAGRKLRDSKQQFQQLREEGNPILKGGDESKKPEMCAKLNGLKQDVIDCVQKMDELYDYFKDEAGEELAARELGEIKENTKTANTVIKEAKDFAYLFREDVRMEVAAALESASEARKAIEEIELRIGGHGGELKPEDVQEVEARLKILEESRGKIEKKLDHPDAKQEAGAAMLKVRLWILDAKALPQGFYIPMYATERMLRDALGRWDELKNAGVDIPKGRNEKKMRAEIDAKMKAVLDDVVRCSRKLLELEKHAADALAQKDLPKDLLDVTNRQKPATEAIKEIRQLRRAFMEFE